MVNAESSCGRRKVKGQTPFLNSFQRSYLSASLPYRIQIQQWPLWRHVHSKLASKVFWAHTPPGTMHSLGILVLSIIEMNKVPANSIGVSVQCRVESTRHGLSLLGEAKYTSRDVGLLDSVRLSIVYAIQPWSQTHQSKLPFSTTPNR